MTAIRLGLPQQCSEAPLTKPPARPCDPPEKAALVSSHHDARAKFHPPLLTQGTRRCNLTSKTPRSHRRPPNKIIILESRRFGIL